MMNLNPNELYDSGNDAGLLTRKLRTVTKDGTEGIRALITAIKDVATADGTIAAVVTAATDLETQFGTPATLNKVVAVY